MCFASWQIRSSFATSCRFFTSELDCSPKIRKWGGEDGIWDKEVYYLLCHPYNQYLNKTEPKGGKTYFGTWFVRVLVHVLKNGSRKLMVVGAWGWYSPSFHILAEQEADRGQEA